MALTVKVYTPEGTPAQASQAQLEILMAAGWTMEPKKEKVSKKEAESKKEEEEAKKGSRKVVKRKVKED